MKTEELRARPRLLDELVMPSSTPTEMSVGAEDNIDSNRHPDEQAERA